MISKGFLTQAGYKTLKAELSQLKKVARGEIAEKIKDARDLGDVLENTVYDSALEEQGYIEGRISELEEILSNSEIVKAKSGKKDVVEVGCTVEVDVDGKSQLFTIVGSAEADPIKKIISNESPVGKALIGLKIGDVVEVKTPLFTAKYKILKIK